MSFLLYCVAAVAFALSVFAFSISFGFGLGRGVIAVGTDIQIILAGVYATVGTVALAGGGIIDAINKLGAADRTV